MKSPLSVSLLAVGLLAGQARTQQVTIRTQKNGNQRTTTIGGAGTAVIPPKVSKASDAAPKVSVLAEEPRKPGDPPAKPGAAEGTGFYPGLGEARAVILNPMNWVCGRHFTDENGRKWDLAIGGPESEKPDKISGWLIRTKDDRLFFFTVNGALFTPPAFGVARSSTALGDVLKQYIEIANPKVVK